MVGEPGELDCHDKVVEGDDNVRQGGYSGILRDAKKKNDNKAKK